MCDLFRARPFFGSFVFIFLHKNAGFLHFWTCGPDRFCKFYAEKYIIDFGQGGLFVSIRLILCIKIKGVCISSTSLIHLDKQKQYFLLFLHLFSIIFVSFMHKNKGVLIARLLFCCISYGYTTFWPL